MGYFRRGEILRSVFESMRQNGTREVCGKLEAYIRDYLALWDFYGVIQVIRGGETLFAEAYGYASIEFGIRNRLESRFALASVSKQFTAFAAMLLCDQNKLDLDRPASRYLPVELYVDESVTVHHLLAHTSGLPNFYSFEDDFFAGYNRMNYSRDEYFRRYIIGKPVRPPGRAYDYNNANYNLLAWIVEHVSGEAFGDYMRDNVFAPLGMTQTETDDGCKPLADRSANYAVDLDRIVKAPYYNEKYSIGAGAVISTCADLYRWYECLRDRRLLSAQSYARFLGVNLNRYCYGLEHRHVNGTDRYSHGGDHLGIGTYVQHEFEDDLSIVILSNNEAIHQYRLGQAISELVHGGEIEAPAKHEEIPVDDSVLRDYCGVYLPNKIEIERIGGKLYFSRFAGNLHIELYPVGEGKLARRHSDQIRPYSIGRNENGVPTFFGYPRISSAR